MYDFYMLGQAYTRFLNKLLDPAFNNPVSDWYMNQYTDVLLQFWFWPGQLVAIQDQLEEFGKIFIAGNICRP